MSEVILVVGLTGAGKTTYCQNLSLEKKALIYSIDKWMKALYWQDMPLDPDMQWFAENSEWYTSRINRCEELMKKEMVNLKGLGISLILDLGFTARAHRLEYLKLAVSLGFKAELHFLDISSDERWKRVLKRNSEKGETFSMTVTREMFDYIEQIFEPISEEEKNLCSAYKFLKSFIKS